jgi:hypothetical protein
VQTEERKQFQLNSQVLIVLGVVFIALALPLAAVIGFAVGNSKPKTAPISAEISPEAASALQKSLEDAAQKSLAPATLNDQPSVQVPADDISSKTQQVIDLTKKLGGSATSIGDGKIWAQVPNNLINHFKQACLAPTDLPLPEGTPDASLSLVEVVIKPKTP